jgi:acetyl esterase
MSAQLDAEAAAFIAELQAAGVPPIETLAPADIRALQRGFVPRLTGMPDEVARVVDREIAGPGGPVPIRIYAPAAPSLGVLVYFHGGGWVIGSIETADAACRALARRTPCTVVSVGYRLAPEHRFPAAVDDAVAATRWSVDHAAELTGKRAQVAVAGDSAGGNLAAAVTLAAVARGGLGLRYQVLVYPAVDDDFNGPSFREYGGGDYLLTLAEMRWYWKNYLANPADAASPLARPLHAASLRGVPPALVVLAECDPLRGDGEAYAKRLRADGVPVETLRYEGLIHGFFTMPGIFSRASLAYDDVAASLRRAFG